MENGLIKLGDRAGTNKLFQENFKEKEKKIKMARAMVLA